MSGCKQEQPDQEAFASSSKAAVSPPSPTASPAHKRSRTSKDQEEAHVIGRYHVVDIVFIVVQRRAAHAGCGCVPSSLYAWFAEILQLFFLCISRAETCCAVQVLADGRSSARSGQRLLEMVRSPNLGAQLSGALIMHISSP